jgi:hypothetical protein
MNDDYGRTEGEPSLPPPGPSPGGTQPGAEADIRHHPAADIGLRQMMGVVDTAGL